MYIDASSVLQFDYIGINSATFVLTRALVISVFYTDVLLTYLSKIWVLPPPEWSNAISVSPDISDHTSPLSSRCSFE